MLFSQAGGPTQSQLFRPVSSRHHISMEHRLRRKHLLLNTSTNATNETFYEETQEKKKNIQKAQQNLGNKKMENMKRCLKKE